MMKILLIVLLFISFRVDFGNAAHVTSQTFKFIYTVIIKDIPPAAKEIEFWIPSPFANQHQSVGKIEFQSPFPLSFINDRRYNNKIIYGKAHNDGKTTLKFSAIYVIERKEWANKPEELHAIEQVSYPKEALKYLEGSRFSTISPEIKILAKKITVGKKTTLSKARALYDYVFENMEYNKEVSGWGNGDSVRACLIGKGNCTDYHSLFNSLARAIGIPAKFVIGFLIPDAKEAEIEGYHCWAAFYHQRAGWVPVDISEAWKNKAKKDYFFGHLDSNRVGFTVGRDIVVAPHLDRLPLNYFVYPYVEIDGKATATIMTSFKSEIL